MNPEDKAFTREAKRRAVGSVFQLERKPATQTDRIEFTDEDVIGVTFPHHDPLVISAVIGTIWFIDVWWTVGA